MQWGVWSSVQHIQSFIIPCNVCQPSTAFPDLIYTPHVWVRVMHDLQAVHCCLWTLGHWQDAIHPSTHQCNNLHHLLYVHLCTPQCSPLQCTLFTAQMMGIILSMFVSQCRDCLMAGKKAPMHPSNSTCCLWLHTAYRLQLYRPCSSIWMCLCGCFRAAVVPQQLESKPLRQKPQLSPDEKKGSGRPGRKSDAELKELYAVHGTYLVPVTEVSLCKLYESPRLTTVRLALMRSQGSYSADTAQHRCAVSTWSSPVAPCIKLSTTATIVQSGI